MKYLAIVVLAVAVIGSNANISLVQDNINAALRYYANTFERTFFNPWELNYAARAMGVAAESAKDEGLRNHIINDRSSYKSYALAIGMILHDAREEIVNNILAQQDVVATKIPDIKSALAEFEMILRDKECDVVSSGRFFNGVHVGMQQQVLTAFEEATNTYMALMRNQFLPMHMINRFFEQISSCLDETDGVACAVAKENLYQRSTLELIRESARVMVNYFYQINEGVVAQLYQGIGQEIYKGYTSIWNFPCGALT